MNNIFIMVLRRMRTPLLLLIAVYTITVLGLTLMPGVSPDGLPHHLSFFQAFYIISYTATTIGFGEVPYPYSPSQRLWVTFSIYLTVICWIYAIGKILTLLQDKSLRDVIEYNRFRKEVRRQHELFFIICGYGETGSLLVNAMLGKGINAVVLENNPEQASLLEFQDLPMPVPTLCADASLADNLILAGLKHPLCQGVVALSDQDNVNLAIAVAVKLLCPHLLLLCRANTQDTADNMYSFNTDQVINPFITFGNLLDLRFRALGACLLKDWLTSQPGETLHNLTVPPIGKWIVCGYGRFGHAVSKVLEERGCQVTMVDVKQETDNGKFPFVTGRGTEAHTLLEAGVAESVGVITATADDVDNLSIVMTAIELKSDLYVVMRQNHTRNRPLFDAFDADINMRKADIISRACLEYMISPLLTRFLDQAEKQSNAWANELIARLVSNLGEKAPVTWESEIANAPAILNLLNKGQSINLGAIMADTCAPEIRLNAEALLIVDKDNETLLPADSYLLTTSCRILFCGTSTAKRRLSLSMLNGKVLDFVLYGDQKAEGWLMQSLIGGENRNGSSKQASAG